MKKIGLFLIACLCTSNSFSQHIVCSAQDNATFTNKIKEFVKLPKQPMGNTVVAIGKSFLGTPYVAKTLEIGKTEALVINFRGLDCTTFIENVLAFAVMIKKEQSNFDDFTKNLETIRYKNGTLNGYPSRLHYFSEWIANNQLKGLLEDVTAEIGGTPIIKEINFMSSHRELYPFLKDNDANLQQIKASENYLNSQEICILPQDQIAANEYLIQSGDIIALTTSIKGLDITHTGIATREKDGRIHLLHASTSGAVEVSKLPLVDYLKGIKSNTGIMVARVSPL
tara:strand:- start:111293 stop:112141 length:849 start_codon:yes stop_codon:yes gene_type:complete